MTLNRETNVDSDLPIDEMLLRLHAALANAITHSQGRSFATPLTVAELYQDLVPYRDVRGPLGFDMNADYEHTLLRLLSGEAGLARLEPAEAREELRLELESPNPNVGLFRKFAACDVWIQAPDPDAAGAGAAAVEEVVTPVSTGSAPPATPAPAAVAGAAVDESVKAPTHQAQASLTPPAMPESGRPAPSAEPAVSSWGDADSSPPAECPFCEAELPTSRPVRFCPYCGANQATRPCRYCGEVLKQDWSYCIACGRSATPDGPI